MAASIAIVNELISTITSVLSDDEKEKNAKRVLISGAAGQIGYSLLPLFATGQVFGPNVPVILHLLEITPALPALNGVRMELEDGAYPLLEDIVCTDKPEIAFKNIDFAVLVGGFPRKKGMLRKDLLAKNSPIFKSMGEGLEKYAKNTCKVLVVANPANTNCLVCANYAPKIPKKNFCALTRLDFNRARAQIANKVGVRVADVKNVVIWGNHSATQVPDINNATINNKAVNELVDEKYVSDEFRPTVQQRGKAIIEARKFSSAMSAANAIKDCLRDWTNGSPANETVAMAIYSDGQYGISKGIMYSFPCICKNGEYEVVTNYKVTDSVKELMKKTETELLDEKAEAGL